ncbi:MAG: chromate transporter [Clostridia bacterium]|nr:chromate transporter [Clostridia bacterium]
MILIQLFLTFLKVGAVSFGGGYGMISLIREEVLAHGWLTEEAFLDFIAVSESTPGPLAVNMATFIGSSQGGFPGALLATLGVVLPAFLIMLAIAALLKNLLKYAGVNAFLEGLRPCVAGLITATAVTMILTVMTGMKAVGDPVTFEWRSVVIFAVVAGIGISYRTVKKKSISPILLILISAGLGVVLYGLI